MRRAPCGPSRTDASGASSSTWSAVRRSTLPAYRAPSTAAERRQQRGGLCSVDLLDRARPGADVLRRGPDELAFALLLEDVRRPARYARAGEQRREEVRRHFGQVQDDGRPELHVGRQHTVGLARVQLRQRRLLERLGDLEARRAQFAAGTAQDTRARVFGSVDAMPEAHQALAAVERL